ncbi:uncharacterized protein EI90DRAFT_3066184 [Cantharellus anzutake]|uniref:uncharacterized protein n=1 Tax=Cantharellus anzutake TaxID=1750568 RepID=UPI001904045D|nr:uncharacterized protein EI90DRAFT_3066184 [Cantharellus anzutake]KAF8327885.1 hypothetical protein EI90DRAFT_3066184 [Cantharellus anzutake]
MPMKICIIAKLLVPNNAPAPSNSFPVTLTRLCRAWWKGGDTISNGLAHLYKGRSWAKVYRDCSECKGFPCTVAVLHCARLTSKHSAAHSISNVGQIINVVTVTATSVLERCDWLGEANATLSPHCSDWNGNQSACNRTSVSAIETSRVTIVTT